MTGPLECRSLRVSYAGGSHAVRDVDLVVGPGECVALVGESGSGKTSVVAAVLGLLPRSATVEGSVRLVGTEVIGASETQLRPLRGRLVGYVAQDPHASCDPLQRVLHHVTEAWRVHRLRPGAGEATARLERLGIEDAALRSRLRPHEWNGGMLQRATIAAATVHDPALVVADEPTSALDHDRAHSVLVRLRAESRSLLLVTHDLDLCSGHADRVAVMYAGRIVEEGPATQVLTSPRHPYTRALQAATPRLGGGLPTALDGPPPPPRRVGRGCAFAPRCPMREDRCLTTVPPLIDGVACPVVSR